VDEFWLFAEPTSIRRTRQSTRWRKPNKSDAQPTREHGGVEFVGVLTKAVQATGM
jgi:hypothetical protein